MYTELYSKFTPNFISYDSFTEFSKAHIKTCNSLGLLQWDLITLNVDTGVEQLKLLTSPENYRDFLAAETDLIEKYQTKANAISQEWVQTVTNSYQDIQQKQAATETVVTKKPATKTKKKATKSKAAKKSA